jgi:hypothetical protein
MKLTPSRSATVTSCVTTPLFRAHVLLQHTYWGNICWMEEDRPHNQLLAGIVREQQAAVFRTQQVAADDYDTSASLRYQSRVVDKTLITLHRAGKYTVQDLIPSFGWSLLEYQFLPPLVKRALSKREHDTFQQCLLNHPGAWREVYHNKPDIQKLLRPPPQVDTGHCNSDPTEAPPGTSNLRNRVFENLEGLYWQITDFEEEALDSCYIGESLCKYFGHRGARTLYFGRVAAQTRQQPYVYRVIYHDGDSEDMDKDKLTDCWLLHRQQGSAAPDAMQQDTQTNQMCGDFDERAPQMLVSQRDSLCTLFTKARTARPLMVLKGNGTVYTDSLQLKPGGLLPSPERRAWLVIVPQWRHPVYWTCEEDNLGLLSDWSWSLGSCQECGSWEDRVEK